MERVEVSFPGGKRIDARIGNFMLHTDQSKKYGGSGSAPEPFDLFSRKLISEIKLFLSLPKGFPEKYHTWIFRAMEKCTIKRHIHETPKFTIEIDG